MKKEKLIGFVGFGEINTPIERLNLMHDEALKTLGALDGTVIDGNHVETVKDICSLLDIELIM